MTNEKIERVLCSHKPELGEVAKAPLEIRSLARQHTALAINTLARMCSFAESEAARVMAANALLDRGWGKAPQAITGENGEGGIEITIRHIVDGGERYEKLSPLLLAHQPLKKVEGE